MDISAGRVGAASAAGDDGTNSRLVALATRVLAAAGLFDMHGHISLRVNDRLYINPLRISRMAVCARDVAVLSIEDGSVLRGEPPSEVPLHLGIYRARSDVRSVAHFHALTATSFAVVGQPLFAAFNAGAVFGSRVPVYDDPDLIQTEREGRAVADALGRDRAVLLRGHGVAVVGPDVPSCVTFSLYLEENAKRLSHAQTLGEPRPFTTDEIARVAASLLQEYVIDKTWIDAQERARHAGALVDLD